MACSPGVFAYKWMYRSLASSPVALLGWGLLNTAIAPSTPAAIAASARAEPTFQNNLVPREPSITEPLTATITAPVTVAFPQFGSSSAPPLLAQAVTAAEDGTGTVVTQTDNTFDITGGTRAGENLFHSFEQFGLSPDQIANILSDPDIENVLGRVVGGDPSVINGLLQLTGGDANLFLINPAGIVFGPESQVIVPAAFTATTADAIQFDDAWLTAIGTNDYASLVGNPIGFAFTNAEPGAVVNGGQLTSLAGDRVTLLGGIVINTGTIETPGGTVTIAAVPGENLVRITQEGNLLSLELPTQLQDQLHPDGAAALVARDLPALLSGGATPANLGVAVEDGVVSIVSTGTPVPNDAGTVIVAGMLDAADETATGTGGAIDVVGDRVGLLDVTLNASGTTGGGTVRIGGDYQGQGDIPNAAQTYVDSRSTIAADALDHGDGGRVIVWADDVTQFFGTITAQGGSVSGNGGFAEVSGKESLRFEGEAILSAPMGDGGQLLLDPGIVIIGANGDDDNLLNTGNPGDPIFIAENQGGTGSTFQISTGQLINTLNNSDVAIAAAQRIDLTQALDASGTDNDLALTAPDINLFEDLILGSGNLTLTSANSSTTAAQEISIFGDVVETNGGGITLNGSVAVDPFDTTIDITTGGGNTGGDITINGTLDSRSNLSPSQVDLEAGTGNVILTGAVGSTEPLTFLNIGGSDISLQDFIGDNLRASGSTFNLQSSGNVTLNRADISASESLAISTVGDLTLDATGFSQLRSFSGEINLSSQGNVLLASNTSFLDVRAEDLTIQADGSVTVRDLPSDSSRLDIAVENLTIQAGDTVSVQDLETVIVSEAAAIAATNTVTVSDSQIDGGTGLMLTGNDVVVTESQLSSEQTLALTAQNTVQISDGAGPTSFRSGDDLTIQGDAGVTVNALSQPESIFVSGGDLALISDGTIIGNGRFLAAGDVAIATVAGDPGTFTYTPVSSPGIISADGNVSFGDYTGAALKVEATGSITGGDITITEANSTLIGTDPDIATLSTSSALILRAGVSPFQLVNNQLPDLDTAQNTPNVTDASPNVALGANSFSLNGAASAPARIEVGRINTSAVEGPVILQASGDIVTGNINVGEGVSEFLDLGDIDISAGGSFCPSQACLTPPDIRGESVAIAAMDDINTSDIETVDIASGDFDPSTSFVRVRTETGDIQVGYILAGAGGIDIDAAGTFRALNSRGSSVNRTSAETIPLVLAQYLNSLGYTEFPDEIAFGDFIEGPETETGVRVSLESVDGAIAIRYGQNREVLVPDENGVLIEGDPSQPFVIGPNYDDVVPFLPGEGRNFDPFDSATNPNGYFPSDEFGSTFEVIENAEPLTFPSDEFPSNAGGIVAGVVASNTDASLSGALQSQLFGMLDPGGETGGGDPGGGTGGGGTGGGVGGGTDGGTGGGGIGGGVDVGTGGGTVGEGTGGGTGGGIDGGEGNPFASTPEEVPPETQNLGAEATDDLCEERLNTTQTADNLLTIDDNLIAGARSPDGTPFALDPCNNREPTGDTPETETDSADPLTPTL